MYPGNPVDQMDEFGGPKEPVWWCGISGRDGNTSSLFDITPGIR
jgi:hypothetical protein